MPHFPDAYICVADDISGVGEALILYISGGLQTLADGLAGFAEFIAAQFFVIDSGYLDADINTVEQWTGDAFLVFSHYGRGTGTGFLRVSKMSAWTGVYTIGQNSITISS